MMLPPLLSPLVSAVLIIASSSRIIATVDAFTAKSPIAAIPSSSSSIAVNYHQSQRLISSSHYYVTTNHHKKFSRQQQQQQQQQQQPAAAIMSLKASTNDNSNNEDQQVETTSTSTSSYNYYYNKITTLIGKTTSTLISLLFFLLLATQRNVLITTLFIGSILNAIVGKILKKILDHDRPFELYETDDDDNGADGVVTTTTTVGTASTTTAGTAAEKKKYNDHHQLKIKPSDGGMPSSHAMSLSFIGTVLFFGEVLPFITRYVTTNNVFMGVVGATSLSAVVPAAAGAAVGVSMMLYSFIALQYRVRVKLHTVEQILVGYTLGWMNAILWLRYAVFSPSLSLSSLFTIVNKGEFGDVGGHGMNHLLGPVSRIVQKYLISNNGTNQFPVVGLVIPILLGIVVVGSFERRIGVWLKKWNDEKDESARFGVKKDD